MANPTIAKELAIYFFQKKEYNITDRKQFAITIKQAKYLLDKGYSEQQIKDAIDYYTKQPPKKGFHSFGFLQYGIDYVIEKKKLEQQKKGLLDLYKSRGDEGGTENRSKLQGNDLKSRIGASIDLNLFKESRENN